MRKETQLINSLKGTRGVRKETQLINSLQGTRGVRRDTADQFIAGNQGCEERHS